MDKAELKQSILDSGIEKYQRLLDDYRKQIKELRESEVAVNEGQFDHQQSAYNDEMNLRITELANQLNFSIEEMTHLKSIRVAKPLHSEIGFGSVLYTDKRNFLVAINIDNFSVGKKKFYGLSMKAPLFGEMQGKKKGDSFTYNGIDYKIKDVF